MKLALSNGVLLTALVAVVAVATPRAHRLANFAVRVGSAVSLVKVIRSIVPPNLFAAVVSTKRSCTLHRRRWLQQRSRTRHKRNCLR